MKKSFFLILLLAAGVLGALEPCRIKTNVPLPSGGSGILMENHFVRLLIEPGRGAGCLQFLDKLTNTNFTTGEQGLRIFSDRLLELSRTLLPELPYAYKIITDTPEKISVEFSREGAPGFQYLTFSRRITLTRNSGLVEVIYSFHNAEASMAPTVVTPYFRHGLSVPSKTTCFYTPTVKGVEMRSNTKGGENKGNVFFRNPSAGYAAVADEGGNGLALDFDYRYLDYIYNWVAGTDRSTLEWVFVPVRIGAGKSFVTRCNFFPFRKTGVPLAAKNGIAGGFDGKNAVLSSAVSGEYAVAVNGRNVGTKRLEAGKNLSLALPDSALKGKSAVLELFRQKKSVFKMFIPLAKGVEVPAECAKTPPAQAEVRELKLSTKIVTPHTPWARPHIKGPVKLLVLCDYQHQREAVELAQRLECTFDVIRISHISSQMSWGMVERFGSFTYKDANAALRKTLKRPYDCIIVSGNLWKYFEADNLGTLRRKLEQGAGLVMITPRELPRSVQDLLLMTGGNTPVDLRGEFFPLAHPAAAGFPGELTLPGRIFNSRLKPGATPVITSLNGPVLALGRPAGIRTAHFSYFAQGSLLPELPITVRRIPDWNYPDYQFIPLIKAILAVSGRLPETVVRGKLTEKAAEFTVTGPLPAGAVLEVTVRNLLRNTAVTRKIALPAPQKGEPCRVSLPAETAPGLNTAEYILRSGGKSVDFGCAVLRRAPEIPVFAVIPERNLYAAGELIRGKVRSVPGGEIKVSLTDSENRLISEATAGADGTFALPVTEASTRLMTLRAASFLKGELQDEKKLNLFVKVKPRLPDYMITASEHEWMWGHNRKFRENFFRELRKSTGFDVMRLWTLLTPDRGGPAYEDYLRYGFEIILPVTGNQKLRNFVDDHQKPFNETGDKKYLARKPCYHDPAFIAKNEKEILTRLKKLEKFSPSQLSFGDEHSLTLFSRELDFCFSAHSLKAFREHLKKLYPSLKALNAQWGSSFGSWVEVMPPTTDEIRKKAAKDGNYSAWADFRDFMDGAFSGYYASSAQVVRKAGWDLDMDLSGCEGGNAYNGMQWFRFSRVLQQCAPYRGSGILEFIRSFGPVRVCPWNSGYSNAGLLVFHHVWLDFFCFKQGGASFYASRNMLFPDYTLQPGTKDYADATHDLRKGLGALRATLDEEDAEVLVHFSQPSLYAAQILRSMGSYRDSRMAWIALLSDLGFNFKFVAGQEIEAGALRKAPARVLILPCSWAISDKECREIRDFASRGGIVVADRHAGVMDGHCRRLKKGALDDLFGLTRSDMGKSTNESVKLGEKQSYIRLVGAARSGKQFCNFRHSFGKGTGVYLNYTINNYRSLRSSAQGREELAAVRRFFLKTVGGKRMGGCTTAFAGGLPEGGRLFTYRQKGAKEALFVGMVREHAASGASQVTFNFRRPGYVYDMRKGTVSPEKRASQKIVLKPGEACFLAVLPEQLKQPGIAAPAAVKQGEVFSFTVQVPGSKLEHAFELVTTGPDGESRRLYSRVVRGKEGKYTGSFRTALNDLPGKWVISARDALSGQKVSRTFEVTPR